LNRYQSINPEIDIACIDGVLSAVYPDTTLPAILLDVITLPVTVLDAPDNVIVVADIEAHPIVPDPQVILLLFVVIVVVDNPPFRDDKPLTPIVPVIVVFVDDSVDEFDIPTQVNKPSDDIKAVVAGVAFCTVNPLDCNEFVVWINPEPDIVVVDNSPFNDANPPTD
jgi:hypothetical protein